MREEYIAADANGGRTLFLGRYVSWSAIVAGLVVALVCQILLTMLGISIGAATIEPMEENNPVEGLAAGAGIWWFVTGLVSLFIGAFVAGRVSGVARKKTGALHGFLMWSSATALTFMLAGTVMGGMFGTGFSALTGAVADPENRQELKQEFEEKKSQLGVGEQSRTGTEVDYEQVNRTGSELRESPATPYNYDAQGTNRIDGRENESFDTARRDATRDDAARADTRMGATGTDTAGGGTVDGGDNQVGGNTNLLNRHDQAGATGDDEGPPVIGSQEEARVRQTGEDVAGAASKAALMGLLALLIGAGTCTWAGSMGAPHGHVPPREHDVRVPTGAVPGEPVRG